MELTAPDCSEPDNTGSFQNLQAAYTYWTLRLVFNLFAILSAVLTSFYTVHYRAHGHPSFILYILPDPLLSIIGSYCESGSHFPKQVRSSCRVKQSYTWHSRQRKGKQKTWCYPVSPLKIRNRIGSKTDPWGTPHNTGDNTGTGSKVSPYLCIPFPPNDCCMPYYHSEFSTQHCLQCIFLSSSKKKSRNDVSKSKWLTSCSCSPKSWCRFVVIYH